MEHDVLVEDLPVATGSPGVLEAFAAGSRREGGGLLLRGPAGIGKSFLLAALRDRARKDGQRVLTTSGVQSEARLSFAGLHQLLRPVLDEVHELPPRQREALLSAFGMSESAAPDPYLIALAVLELLTHHAAEEPVLAVVDDTQWLDRPTAEALAFVVRRLGEDAVAVVVAAREGYATPFDDLDLTQLELGPLDEKSSESLLDSRAPALETRLRTRILGQALGNPLAIVELAKVAPTGPAPEAPCRRLAHDHQARERVHVAVRGAARGHAHLAPARLGE